MDNRNYLSFRALMRHDMLSYLCYMLPLVTMIMIVAALVFPAAPVPFLLGLLIVMLPIVAVVLAARVAFVRSVYRKSEIVKGKIDEMAFFGRGWMRITYSYTLNEQRYSTSNRIVKNAFTTSFFPKQEVLVAADPQKPRRAFVVELYQG